MAIFAHGRVREEGLAPRKIDLRDKKILAMLSEDGRMPLSVIAKRLRTSRDTVDYRIRRLVKNGTILGFIPQINFSYFGYNTYHVFMVVNTLNEERKLALVKALSCHPNTRSVMEYHDSWDFEWVLVARSLREFDSTVADITDEFKDIIVRKDKLAIVRGFKSIQLPGMLYRESAYYLKRAVKRKGKSITVDGTDIEILRALSANARQSTYELSRLVKISPDAVGYRIKRLLSAGVIYGFTILTNLSGLDYHWYTFCINVKTFSINNEMRFREFISNNPHILRAVKVLGDWDLLVYIVADTSKSFHTTFKQIQENLSEVISDYQTWAAYEEHVYDSFPDAVRQSVKFKAAA